jgi:hypothetical protein
MHWNLIRVHTGLVKAIEVFEPMGKPGACNHGGGGVVRCGGAAEGSVCVTHPRLPAALTPPPPLIATDCAAHRSGSSQHAYKTEGLSLRSVPRQLIEWLDTVCPLPIEGGWRARTVSAITSQQQGNGFDCGVACLLYAEKCGQRQEREDIGGGTDQTAITWYRALLQAYFQSLASSGADGDGGGESDGAGFGS